MKKTQFMCLIKAYCLLFLSLLLNGVTFAQGDSPSSSLLTPTGVFGIPTKYVNLSTNLSPATFLVKHADFNIPLFSISDFQNKSYNRTFAGLEPFLQEAEAGRNVVV